MTLHDNDAADDDEFDCSPDLADFIESEAGERGEEAAHSLMRFMERMEDGEIDEMSDAQVSHEWIHGLGGFLGGLLRTLSEETVFSYEDMEIAVADAAAASGLDLTTGQKSDDRVTNLEDEQLDSFIEIAGAGIPDFLEEVDELATFVRSQINIAASASSRDLPAHVMEGALLMALITQLTRSLRAVPDVGYGLSRVFLQTAMSETLGEQENAAMTAVTEGPQAIRRAQVIAKAAVVRPKAAKTSGPKTKRPKKPAAKRPPSS